jgi:ribonuclease-3
MAESLLFQLFKKLDYQPTHRSLFDKALTHQSFANENFEDPTSENNERLEYLGDAVLDLIVADLLMRVFPMDNEGLLSRKRSFLVSEKGLADIAMELDLAPVMRLGKGELKNNGTTNQRLLASTLEALMGAFYLDSPFEKVKEIAESLFLPRILQLEDDDKWSNDYKTNLQEVVQKLYHLTPTYHLLSAEGPDHERHFIVEVRSGEQALAMGEGLSKKKAEQDAAGKALRIFAAAINPTTEQNSNQSSTL